MSCQMDHAAVKSSLENFRRGTFIAGLQDDGEGGAMLMGNCLDCGSSLLVPVEIVRGHVSRAGEISTTAATVESAEDHAKRVIT